MDGLNSYVNAFFNGFLFVVVDYFRTALLLISRPRVGLLSILAHMRASQQRQMQPYTYLFVNSFLLISTSSFLSLLYVAHLGTL